MGKTLYIAGPMRGLAEFNFPEFDRAALMLRHANYNVINPADHDRENGFDGAGMTGFEPLSEREGFDLKATLTWDLQQVAYADGVAVLNGWEKSSGARAEVATAHALGVPVAPVAQWTYPEAIREYIRAETPRSDNKAPGPLIVGLNGFARSGKDTAAQGLIEAGFQQFALADPIRRSMLALDPLMPSGIRFSERVESYNGNWDDLKKDVCDGVEARRLMQRFGTEVGRDLLGANVWIDVLAKRIAESDAGGVAVSDVRFDNEAEWVLSQGGIVIEIVRPGVGPANGHASEKPLSRRLVTESVVNDGTVEDLHRKVRFVAACAAYERDAA